MLWVRRASDADLDRMSHVIAHSWQEAYKGLLDETILEKQTKPENRLPGLRRGMESGAAYWILEKDGEARGMAAARVEGQRMEIDAFYTRKSVWGQGGAALMMESIMVYARDQSCKNVCLWVLTENRRARRFYEKCGFAVGGIKSAGIADARGGDAMEIEMIRDV